MAEGSEQAPPEDTGQAASNGGPIRIKKYANRRLYNTATSSYVTLDHLAQMVKQGQDFVVHDAKTGEDITRAVLTQIIVEEEAKGQTMLPVNFLRQLISFYGDNLQALVPGYLEKSMAIFAHNQQQIRQSMEKALGMFPFANQLEEMGKQNMAFLQNAMQMFSPFRGPEGPRSQSSSDADRSGSDLDQMRAQLAEMQRRLDELQKKG